MPQDRLTAVKNFIDVAMPVGLGASWAGAAMKRSFDSAVYSVMDYIDVDTVGDDIYQRIYDAADFLGNHSTALGTLWGVGCAALIFRGVRKGQKQMANELAIFRMEEELKAALAQEFPQPKKPGLLARFLA